MKALKYILSVITAIIVVWSCSEIEDNFDFVSTAKSVENVSALYSITQDNTGLVTMTPNSEGAVSYEIFFGDGTVNPVMVKPGESVKHVYKEGNYKVKIVGTSITGAKTEKIQDLVVSFIAPRNLVVVIENDLAVSKKVNVTANAEFATFFEVYFGETGNTTPVSANIGGTASYIYKETGKYTIRVVAKGGAIQTTTFTKEFDVTAILQPIASASTPPSRLSSDVISIYGHKYSNIAGTNFNPDWGQSGQGSGYAEFDLNGDKMLQYIKLSYQGISLGSTINVTGMDYLHMDVWTADVNRIETSLINGVDGNSTEKPVWKNLTAGEWTSIDIPLSAFTSQGLSVDKIFQLKFVGDGWAAGTVFIDNIYFYKTPSAASMLPTSSISSFENYKEISSFDGGEMTVVANPSKTGNSSDFVAKLVKGSGQVWAGSKITFNDALTFNNETTVKLKIWSPRVGLKLTTKFEDATPWPNTIASAEVTATTTKANQWEEVTFDFSGISSSVAYTNMVFFIDLGVNGDGSANYTVYVDDIKQFLSTQSSTIMDFEKYKEISSFDGGDITVVANPSKSGNSSDFVAKLVKGSGQVWAGSKITFDNALTFTSETTVKMKVWSPRVGLKLLAKFEDATPWPATVGTAEVVAVTTKANQWEELTFDFSGISTSVAFTNMVLIMDNGTGGDGSANYTIYVDDIKQN
jgi:hypothetical protein